MNWESHRSVAATPDEDAASADMESHIVQPCGTIGIGPPPTVPLPLLPGVDAARDGGCVGSCDEHGEVSVEAGAWGIAKEVGSGRVLPEAKVNQLMAQMRTMTLNNS